MTHSHVATHANILRNLALHALIIQYDHHIETSYRTMGNFWIIKFSKNIGWQRIWNNIFEKWSRDLASCHHNSIVLKIHFKKLQVIFKIFINKMIQELSLALYDCLIIAT